MASLLTDPVFETSGRGPAPNNNFYSFSVTTSDVIWRWWKISPRTVDRNSKPGELKESHQDFLDDPDLQRDVSTTFGLDILEYIKGLCQGHYDYLERLSDSLLLRIVSYLDLEDVGQLARTSHRFRQLCGSEEFWEQAVRQSCNTVSGDVSSLALEAGWRTIFFTSKLQLQKLIGRRKIKTKKQSHPGDAPELSLGMDTGTDFDTSSYSDEGPNQNPEPGNSSDSSEPAPDE